MCIGMPVRPLLRAAEVQPVPADSRAKERAPPARARIQDSHAKAYDCAHF